MVVRTLTEWLRGRRDEHLRDLLVARPDLVNPVPADLGGLAERAATQASVTRALDRLDHATLRVVEALTVLPGPASHDDLLAAFPEEDAASVRHALSTLRRLALVWDDEDGLRPVRSACAALAQPAGLGPPASTAFRDVDPARLEAMLDDLGLGAESDAEAAAGAIAAQLAKPDVLDELIENAGNEARGVLDRLAWGPPVGTVADATRGVRLATAGSPVERLLARGLLAPAGRGTVVLPREVALHLRGGLLFRHPDAPPDLDVRDRGAEQAERTAAGQAFTAVRTVEDLLEMWSADPPPVLRGGGLGVRDLRRSAYDLNLTEEHAALYVEVAYAADLLGSGSGVDGEWLPTQAYDVWRTRSPQQRWVAVAAAWLESSRVPGLVGGRDERDRPINALGTSLHRTGASETRHGALEVLAELPPGTSATAESLRERLRWLRPRRWNGSREQIVTWTTAEAETLGLTGLGSLPSYARALLAGDTSGAAEQLAPLLPEAVDHVLLQPDLTAVAPGPLARELGRELSLAADVESTGGATVYRFTQSSVRRALDAGRTAGELLKLLEQHSRTSVPQPLRYLVDDVARAHGRIRVGTAAAFLRCDDPATLTELLADRRAAALGLRRLADTVLASRTGQQELTERLRALGYAPMAESAEGELLLTRAESRRAGTRDRPPRQGGTGPAPDERLATAAVRALRAGDRAATASRRPVGRGGSEPEGAAVADGADTPRSSAASTVAGLRAAAEASQPLWIGYLDAQGHASSRIVEPLRVEGGFLTAFDSTRDAVHRFALHRITGVATLDDASA